MHKYSLSMRIAHWSLALLFLAIFSAVWFTGLGEPKVRYGWHKSLGLLAFGLVCVRALIRLKTPKPDPAVMGSVHACMVRWGHRALYLLMGLVPLTMLVPASLSRGIDFFAWHFEPIAHNPELAKMIAGFHIPLAYTFVAVIVGHIAMALYHHFVRKDGMLSRII